MYGEWSILSQVSKLRKITIWNRSKCFFSIGSFEKFLFEKDNGLLRCRNCGHPVLSPVLSDFCTNCGQLTGVRKDSAYDSKHGEILFEVPSVLGKSYKFFSDKFVIYKGSRELEEIPYSSLKDCDVKIRSGGRIWRSDSGWANLWGDNNGNFERKSRASNRIY